MPKGCIREKTLGDKNITLCKVWIFAKLFGTRSLVCLGQRICCTNLIANKVVDFYHMVIKVQTKLRMSTKQTESNVQSPIDLFTNTMPHQMKALEMIDKMCDVYCMNLGRVFESEAIR
jgi:hypothetical protein